LNLIEAIEESQCDLHWLFFVF